MDRFIGQLTPSEQSKTLLTLIHFSATVIYLALILNFYSCFAHFYTTFRIFMLLRIHDSPASISSSTNYEAVEPQTPPPPSVSVSTQYSLSISHHQKGVTAQLDAL